LNHAPLIDYLLIYQSLLFGEVLIGVGARSMKIEYPLPLFFKLLNISADTLIGRIEVLIVIFPDI